MTTLSTRGRPRLSVWTVADLHRRFGPMLYSRIRHDPPPGLGTVNDVVRLNDHEDRLYARIDGILVEKTAGLLESGIAIKIARLLGNFVDPRDLGIVTGADGAIELEIGLVRIPDVSFFSYGRMPGGKLPREPIPHLIPDLVVEVISASNTRKEMDEKLEEYF